MCLWYGLVERATSRVSAVGSSQTPPGVRSLLSIRQKNAQSPAARLRMEIPAGTPTDPVIVCDALFSRLCLTLLALSLVFGICYCENKGCFQEDYVLVSYFAALLKKKR